MKKLPAICIFFLGIAVVLISVCKSEPPKSEPLIKEATPYTDIAKLSRWRGFNLLEKFTVQENQPYKEEDFKLIAELGFNFVRLPLDYRCFARGTDYSVLHEKTMRELDKAVEYGVRYNIHVCFNFHRAPGYCVNPPFEKSDLFKDSRTQDKFAALWAVFAARYKGVLNENLSFNLLNEPAGIESAVYALVMAKAIKAIREIDPHRLIVIDGLEWGRLPVAELKAANIIQATRGYDPIGLTHYKADWIDNSYNWSSPAWPGYMFFSSYLFGPIKKEYQTPLIINVDIRQKTRLRIKVHKVSHLSRLIIKADNEPVFDKVFEPGPGKGEWSRVIYEAEWDIYQNIYDKYYSTVIPTGTEQITIENTEGDWLLISEIRIDPYNGFLKNEVILLPNVFSWGSRQGELYLSAQGSIITDKKNALYDSQWLREVYLAPWIKIHKQGVPVIVGEFGVFRHTPHDVTLAWMEDFLKVVKKEGFGWALWNFRGSFGILDSNRKDVHYKNFHGHKLDAQMLELLIKY